MNLPPSLQLGRHRRRRKRRAGATSAAPAPGVDQIVSVAFGPGGDQVTVTVAAGAGGVASIADAGQALWVSADGGGTWIGATAAVVVDALHVRFDFGDDVTDATVWHVEDPAAWVFVDGGAMVGPFDGEM